ncbi:DUF1405 domain-containing protein [Halorarum salinum]|uniref:DUF1405 domain-containing protein n=1 Tax=Halorarum salinum TaxID=2743089 RepID=A0A7D5QF90_9EURY|nr:DUF1405 domain-containing protein [Halobaculum salinum]QLG63281.1 DUF1405 domain-containing protein [Halobaculum salinum]
MDSAADVRALFAADGLPEPDDLPRYVAPLPRWLENFGLRFAGVIALINLVGTAFGFWYYGLRPVPASEPLIAGQFSGEPAVMWAFVPDSPVATLFIAVALGLWWLGRPSEYWNALAFFGCWKLGLWTPFVLLAFADGFLASTAVPMYLFLFFSHLAMVLEAFLIHRFSAFPLRAVAVAAAWYGLNDLVDYVVPVVGTPHHTLVPGQAYDAAAGGFTHPPEIHALAAAGAVTLTVTATLLAVATNRAKAAAAGATD